MFSNMLIVLHLTAMNFPGICRLSASDTAISSYILTPQGQIAAHSDSSRNQTWISDSIKQMFLENTNSFFKDNDIYYNCRTLDNGWLHITEIPENYIQKQYTGTDQNTVDHCNYFSAADYFYCNPFFQETDKQNCRTVLCHGILSSRT